MGKFNINHGLGFGLVLTALFVFRVYYGLSLDFWNEDERQIYLLGLQWFTTGNWPFFGPDVVHTNHQIAGALQAVMVGLPFHLWAQPEAPIVFLNILSFAGLTLLASYLCRLIPEAPRALLFIWLFTLPWTLNISTHVYNPSYLLVASCLFFVGFGEVLPSLRTGLMPKGLGFFLMGLGFAWNAQLHLSWPLLLPFMAVACLALWRAKQWRWSYLVAGTIGLAVPGLLLLPTALKFGPMSIVTPLFANSRLNEANAYEPFTIMARFLSFGAYELPRFLTDRSQDRLPFILEHYWLIPFALVVGLVGLLQPLFFLAGVFRRGVPPAMRWLILLSIVEVCLAFVTSARPPTARNYYVLFPVAAAAAAYGMRFVLASPQRQRLAAAVVGLGIVYQGLLAEAHLRHQGLYKDRARVAEALSRRDYRVVGERRASLLPPALW